MAEKRRKRPGLARFRLRWPPIWWRPARRSGPPTAWTHLADLHDVFAPEDARQAAARTRHDPHLAADLRRPRPAGGLEGPPGELLLRLWQTEGPGLLARLGEAGPWVYVPDVAALQELARAYEALVRAAWTGGEAAQAAGDSLLARLEFQDGGAVTLPADGLFHLEEAFWRQAGEVSRRRRAARAAGVWP